MRAISGGVSEVPVNGEFNEKCEFVVNLWDAQRVQQILKESMFEVMKIANRKFRGQRLFGCLRTYHRYNL